MSNKAYQSIPALSHSLIANCKNYGYLVAWRKSPFNPESTDAEPSDALEQGQLYHCLIRYPEIVQNLDAYMDRRNICLNPDAKTPKDESLGLISVDDTTVIFVFDFGASRKNKKYTDLHNYLVSNNMWTDNAIICTQDELDNTMKLLQFIFVHPHYVSLSQYEKIGTEEVIEFTLDDNPCKAEIDALYKVGPDQYLIVDWKTTRYCTRQAIQRCGEYLDYHIQDYIYCNAVAAKYGVPVENVKMCFIMQNKTYPEIVYRVGFSDESYQQGESDFAEYGRDFMARLQKSKTDGFVAFMDVCSELTFSHNPTRFYEQPDQEFGR